MTDSFITVTKRSREEIVINRSKFIGYASPCADENETLSFIRQIKEENRTATHNCYAYVLGENSGIIRYSDDGEPGGTAGMPILDVIRTRHIVNCCVVVTRYFGGILLGTGGLVRAYTQSCQAALNAAGISVMRMTSDDTCSIPYSYWDRIRYISENLPARIEHVEYGSDISFHLQYCCNDKDLVISKLLDASDRQMVIHNHSETYMPWSAKTAL